MAVSRRSHRLLLASAAAALIAPGLLAMAPAQADPAMSATSHPDPYGDKYDHDRYGEQYGVQGEGSGAHENGRDDDRYDRDDDRYDRDDRHDDRYDRGEDRHDEHGGVRDTGGDLDGAADRDAGVKVAPVSDRGHAGNPRELSSAEIDKVMLRNNQTGKCLTIAEGARAADNLDIVQYTCDDDPARRWTLRQTSPYVYQIENMRTGKCLTVADGARPVNNLRAVQYTCDDNAAHRWRLTDVSGDGDYQIKNMRTGKCLTVAGGARATDNLRAVQYTCDDNAARRWTLRIAG
ncbi:RICIN domain-containing protein [Planomonospora alba]